MNFSFENKRSNTNEDKKLIGNAVKVVLAGSMIFGLPSLAACSSGGLTEGQQSVEKVRHYCGIEEANYFVVYHTDDLVIIIPTPDYEYHEYGYFSVKTFYYEGSKWQEDCFPISSIEHITSDYEAAKNYSSMLSEEFFLYCDVAEGNPVNLNDLGEDAKVLTKNMN